MSVIINGDTGITTPAETVQGALTTTGNTILGDASTDTLNVGNGGLVKDASGNVGIGTASPAQKLDIASKVQIDTANSYGKIKIARATDSGVAALYIQGADNAGTGNELSLVNTGGGGAAINITGGDLRFYASSNTTERMRIDSSGGLILAGSTAQKSTGTTWSNPSDRRLKDNIRDYANGMTELMQVRVREWEYNGKGGTTKGMKGLGVIADEVMTVLPATVENYNAKLNVDDEETTDIKRFDATEITWLLVKTVQELKAIVDAQAVRIAALES